MKRTSRRTKVEENVIVPKFPKTHLNQTDKNVNKCSKSKFHQHQKNVDHKTTPDKHHVTKKHERKNKSSVKHSHEEIIVTPPSSPPNDTYNIDVEQDKSSKKDGSPGLTPTEKRIKEIFRDEFLFSQNGTESLCDVRWDCTSPDAIRQAMKRPIKKTQAVSELAQRLKVSDDELNYEEQDVKDKSLLGLCQPNIGFADAVKKENRKSKRGIKKRSKGVLIAPDITQQYQAWLDEIEALRKAEEQVKVTEVCDIPCEILSDDNICKTTLLDDPGIALLLEDDTLLPTGVIKCAKTSSSENTDDGWSDDELFDEDSFLMQATQMSENKLAELCKSNKRKRDSLGLTGKPSKDLRTVSKTDSSVNQNSNANINLGLIGKPSENLKTVSKSSVNQRSNVNNNSSVTRTDTIINKNITKTIPKPILYNNQTKQTVISKQTSIPVQNKPVLTNSNSANPNSFLSRNSFYSSTKSPFRKHNSFSGSPTNISNISPVENNVKTSVKSPFRKHKSFDVSQHLTSTPTGKTSTTRTSRTDFQRSLSNSGLNCGKKVNNNVNSVINKNSVRILPKITEEKSEPKNIPKPKSLIDNFLEENDSFLDTSISDEILRQLAEPDEVLESQTTPEELPVKKEVKADANENIVDDEVLQEMFDDDFSFSDINMNLEDPPVQKVASNSLVQKGVTNVSTEKGLLFNPSAQKGLSNASVQKGLLNPSAQKGLLNPSAQKGLLNPSAPKGLLNPSAPKGLSNASAPKGLSNASAPKGLSNASAQKGLSNASAQKGLPNPSAQNVTNKTLVNKVLDSKFVKQGVNPPVIKSFSKIQQNCGVKGQVSSNLLVSKITTNTRTVSPQISTNQTQVKKLAQNSVKPTSVAYQNKFNFKKKSPVRVAKTNQIRPGITIQNQPRNIQSTTKTPLNKSISLTQDLFNDDSFDDPLIESQFLAELEKVESSLKSSKS